MIAASKESETRCSTGRVLSDDFLDTRRALTTLDRTYQALEYLLSAEEMYVRGFTENHPKVAWALEGIAKARPRSDLGATSARSRRDLDTVSA